jgi:hypothetical protein
MAVVVEVNEGVIDITQQGATYWHWFRAIYDRAGRLRETKAACIVGGLVEVACDDDEHAKWLAAHMVENGGIPRTAVRVKAAAPIP